MFFVFNLETFFWNSKIASKFNFVGVGYKFGTLRWSIPENFIIIVKKKKLEKMYF